MKKGFTLVEVLALLVILGIISIITVPAIQGILNDSKEKACKEQIRRIEIAAQSYNADRIATRQEPEQKITISQLSSYISGELKNPKTKQQINGIVYVCDNTYKNTYIYSENPDPDPNICSDPDLKERKKNPEVCN